MNEELVKEALDILTGIQSSRSAISDAADLLSKAIKPKQRFYKSQPVLVSDDNQNWHKGSFTRYSNEAEFPFTVDRDSSSFTSTNRFCKPDPDQESIINWIEHDGSEKRINGDIIIVDFGAIKKYEDYVYLNEASERYAIIPLPKWID